MRRNFISITSVKRIASSYNRIKKEQYYDNILKEQGGSEKEKPPFYRIEKVDFNSSSRVTHVEILQSQQYRTIQKYITRNYEKYPIFSDWKTKEKIIKKTIKLTNAELESLNNNEDDLIKQFAEDIIISLDNEDLFPSWFIKSFLKKQANENLKILNSSLKEFSNNKNQEIFSLNTEIDCLKKEIDNYNICLSKFQKKKDKKIAKIARIENSKSNGFKIIFSFGLFYYFSSQKRKEKIKSSLLNIEREICVLNQKILENEENIDKNDILIKNCVFSIREKEKEIQIKKQNVKKEYNKNVSEIVPLPCEIDKDENFKPLKQFCGLEYEKIIGVYVIHNKENNKYYVGQSKDVLKRLKQHFNGTIPKNSIFFEDYYSSNEEKREDLFEVKIIICSTKDELDSLEKKLISDYDSWNNGYNKTSGNY